MKIGRVVRRRSSQIAERADRVDRLIRVHAIKELMKAHVFARIFRPHAPMTQ
jgi:hypothetical protein